MCYLIKTEEINLMLGITKEYDSIERVQERIAYYFRILPEEMFNSTRKRNYIDARCLFYYICYTKLTMTVTGIGNYAGKNHATVLNGMKTFEQLRETDKRMKRAVDFFLNGNYTYEPKRIPDVEILDCVIWEPAVKPDISDLESKMEELINNFNPDTDMDKYNNLRRQIELAEQ